MPKIRHVPKLYALCVFGWPYQLDVSPNKSADKHPTERESKRGREKEEKKGKRNNENLHSLTKLNRKYIFETQIVPGKYKEIKPGKKHSQMITS